MAEYYFDHPEHGATVACDTNEAKRLMGYGWILRDPQPDGITVPAEIASPKKEAEKEVFKPDMGAPEADVFPVKQPAKRGRQPKAA